MSHFFLQLSGSQGAQVGNNSGGLPGEREFRAKRTCSPHPGSCLFVGLFYKEQNVKSLGGQFPSPEWPAM